MKRVSLALACAAMLFTGLPAVASDDVQSELAEMRDLVQGLKQKVEAQEEQIEQQGQLLEEAQQAVRESADDESRSGISPFLDSVSVGGHISGSYVYSLNTPQRRGFDGFNQQVTNNFNSLYVPFHQDNDTFTVDQVWFSIGKEATEESRAGFQFDILFGENATSLGQGTLALRKVFLNDSTSEYYVAQAYLEYQCDCLGPEVDWKFGKFQTPVGAEVVQATGNFNITRGIVYGFQPVDHLGLTATSQITDMVEFTAGLLSSGGSSVSSPDNNDEMTYLASLLLGDDKMNLRTSFLYGGEPRGDLTPSNDHFGTLDLTAWFNPSDTLSLWVNYDYIWQEDTAQDVSAIALAGRLQVTDALGAAVRAEYAHETSIRSPDNQFFSGIIAGNTGQQNLDLYSITGTVDYALTDHLTTRGEIRYDKVGTSGTKPFLKNRGRHDGLSDDQTLAVAEVIYSF